MLLGTFKIMKKTMTMFKITLALIGLTLMTVYGCWQITLGVFLLMWANNAYFVKKTRT